MALKSSKQESFCQAIADGKNQSEAYRLAFNAKNMKPESVQVNASKLMADAKVTLRVKELRGNLENKQLWTREMSVKALINAYKLGNPSVKVSAVKELNIMHGYNAPIKHDVKSTGGFSINIVTTKKDLENE